MIVAALGIVASAAAQVAAPPSPKAAPPPTLAQIGMFIYPAQQQTKEQQAGDEEACTRWAESQTGLVVQARSVDTQAAAKAANPWPFGALGLLLAVAIAAASYRYLETPLARRLRRRA